jgi:Flp pilus assembly protein TadG
MKTLLRFIRDKNGGPAAEFALVLPVALLFLFGIIDVGRFMYEYNQAEKATQMGVRYAVATDIVASGLSGYSFATSCGVPQGSPISTAQFPGMSCVGGGTVAAPTATCSLSAASTCTATAIPTTASAPAIANIVNRMRLFKYDIVPTNVTVTYANSGLGYAGDPNGLDVAPLVTVTVEDLVFRPITIMIFNATMPMPDFSYTLTMEDGAGTFSN